MTKFLTTTFLIVVVFAFSSSIFGAAESSSKGGCQSTSMSFLDVDSNVFIASSNSTSTVSTAGFEGCWTYWPSGPCRAIYRNGNSYKICGQCDDFGNPGSGGCSTISIQTLNRGYWCS